MVDEIEDTTAKVLEQAAGFVAIVTGVSIAISVARQVGFFSSIDPKIMALMSIADIVQNSLYAVPTSILAIFSGPLARIYRPASIGALGSPGPVNVIVSYFFKPYSKIDLYVDVVYLSVVILFSENWPLYAAILLVGELPRLLTWVSLNEEARRFRYSVELFMILVVIFSAYLLGMSEGRVTDLRPDYLLETQGAPMPINLLRTTADNFIIRHPDGSIAVVRRDQVRELQKIEVPRPTAILPLDAPWTWLQDRVPLFRGPQLSKRREE